MINVPVSFVASLPSTKPWNKEERKGMMVFSFYRLVSKDEGGLSFSSGSAYRLELRDAAANNVFYAISARF